MNILQLSLLLVILLKCITASGSGVAPDVIKALSEDGFESIKKGWKAWKNRDDLFDYVVMKSVEFIVGFINQVEVAKRCTLAALFIKSPDKIDNVLEKIKYDENDLKAAAMFKLKLVESESHETFLKIVGMINTPEVQKLVISEGVGTLFHHGKHDSVIPLINALGEKFKDINYLENAAIKSAFYQGALRGIKYFVEEFHEHPAITSEEYAAGLINSGYRYMPNPVFSFLLSQADQGDLEEVKQKWKEDEYPEFHKSIDEATETAPAAGMRHIRFFGRAMAAILILNDVMITGEWLQDPGAIIASYLIDEHEGPKLVKSMRQESATPRPSVEVSPNTQAKSQTLLKSTNEILPSISKQSRPVIIHVLKPAPSLPPPKISASRVNILPSASKQSQPKVPAKTKVEKETEVNGRESGPSVKDLREKFGET